MKATITDESKMVITNSVKTKIENDLLCIVVENNYYCIEICMNYEEYSRILNEFKKNKE